MNTTGLKTQKPRTQKRAKRTRKKLKKAALDIFSEKSVAAATVEEITEKADVGKGTLYQHFEDKEHVIVTLVDEAIEHLIERIRSCEPEPESPKKRLENLFDAHYDFVMDCREEFILLLQGKLLLKLESDGPEELEGAYLRYLGEIENRLRPYLHQKNDPDQLRRMACAVAGFLFGFFSFALIGMTAKAIKESLGPFKRDFVRSLAALLGK